MINRTLDSLNSVFIFVSLVLGMLVFCSYPSYADSDIITQVSPASLYVKQKTKILVSAETNAKRVYIRTALKNDFGRVIGRLRDNGKKGDLLAGDGIATGSFRVRAKKPGKYRFFLSTSKTGKKKIATFILYVLKNTSELERLLSSTTAAGDEDEHSSRDLDFDMSESDSLAKIVKRATGQKLSHSMLVTYPAAGAADAGFRRSVEVHMHFTPQHAGAKKQMKKVVTLLGKAGITTKPFDDTLKKTRFHTLR